jgi:hypothetical protein
MSSVVAREAMLEGRSSLAERLYLVMFCNVYCRVLCVEAKNCAIIFFFSDVLLLIVCRPAELMLIPRSFKKSSPGQSIITYAFF